jgi:hypothetical protein
MPSLTIRSPASTYCLLVILLSGRGPLGRASDGALVALPTLPEGDQGIAAHYPNDDGIEYDPAVIFRDDFESGDMRNWDNWFQKVDVRFAEEPANVHTGRRSLEFTVPQQNTELSDGVVKDFKEGQDVVFLRYYSKFDRGFDQVGSSHNGAILEARSPGLPYSSPGVRANGKNKFIVSLEDWRGEVTTPSPGALNVYVYDPEQRSDYGDHFFPTGTVLPHGDQPGDFGPDFVPRLDFTPALDRWYCYELMVKANTPGKRDGRIAFWVDGKLIGDFPNLRLRDVATLKINRATLSLHIRNNTVRENKKWYDDVVAATSYIGPLADKRFSTTHP